MEERGVGVSVLRSEDLGRVNGTTGNKGYKGSLLQCSSLVFDIGLTHKGTNRSVVSDSLNSLLQCRGSDDSGVEGRPTPTSDQ